MTHVVNMRGLGESGGDPSFQWSVRVDRTTKWGNPFKIGKDGTRSQVIEKYRKWITEQPKLLAALGELRGERLGCWCAPLPCHADVLAELADRQTGGTRRKR